MSYTNKSKQNNVFQLDKLTLSNKNYRQVIHTTPQEQLVLMNIPYMTEIGMEKHEHTTQFIKVVSGSALAHIADNKYKLKKGDAVIISPNTKHNIISTSKRGLKLYTIYSPPEHAYNLTQKFKP